MGEYLNHALLQDALGLLWRPNENLIETKINGKLLLELQKAMPPKTDESWSDRRKIEERRKGSAGKRELAVIDAYAQAKLWSYPESIQ